MYLSGVMVTISGFYDVSYNDKFLFKEKGHVGLNLIHATSQEKMHEVFMKLT